MSNQASMAHRLYYLPITGIPALAGWIEHWNLHQDLEPMMGNVPSLMVEKFHFLSGGLQHWGWVSIESLRAYTMSDTNSDILLRFMELTLLHNPNETGVVVVDTEAQIAHTLRRRGRSVQFYTAEETGARMYNPDNRSLYLPCGLAKHILHTVMCAKAQGIAARQLRVFGHEVEDAEVGTYSVPFIRYGEQREDLPQQPFFMWFIYGRG